MFKYDTHVHTSEISRCGRVTARDGVRLYRDAGYDGIIITDHFCSSYFDSIRGKTWASKVDQYLYGYRQAFDEGNKAGLKVFLGMEIMFDENLNDYLIYGFDENFLYDNPGLCNLGLKNFRDFIKGSGIKIIQAHPFRSYITAADPLLLDGVEVYNGNPRHDSRNHLALQMANKYKLAETSGSDFHQIEDLARGGMESQYPLNSIEDFLKLLDGNLSRLITS